jgi:hypothetical protein
MDLQEVGWGMDCNNLAQGRERVPIKCIDYLRTC